MERHEIRLITFEETGDGIQVNLMSDLSEELAVRLISDHYLVVAKLGRGCQ
jgi:hypothetical protein